MIPAALVMPFDLIDKHTWLISGAPQSSEIVEMEPPMLINQRFMNLGPKVLASCLINNFQLWIHHRRIPCRRPLAKSDPHQAASNSPRSGAVACHTAKSICGMLRGKVLVQLPHACTWYTMEKKRCILLMDKILHQLECMGKVLAQLPHACTWYTMEEK